MTDAEYEVLLAANCTRFNKRVYWTEAEIVEIIHLTLIRMSPDLIQSVIASPSRMTLVPSG